MKSPILLLRSLLTDVKRLIPTVCGLDRDLETIKHRVKNEGFSFLSVALPVLCDALDKGLSDGRFTCPSHFKRVKNGALPRLFQGLLCDVFDITSGVLKDDASIESIKCLREILRLFKKTRITSSREDFLHAKAIESFLETDRRLVDQFFDNRLSYCLTQVCNVILPDLESRFGESNNRYRHGPGAVRDGVKGNSKWTRLFDIVQDDSSSFLPNELDFFYHTSCEKRDLTPLGDSEPFGGIAKLITVPKTSVALRTITIEPLWNQFLQQGLNTTLRDSIEQCSILRNSLALSNQEPNQRLALEGSRTGEWTTIDLSSASDLLSLKLVSLVFGRFTAFHKAMIECRSNIVECEKFTLQILKFAGMGNALTFPVQSVCFAAICIAAVADAMNPLKKASYRDIKRASESVRVFGDDIVVRTEHYQSVRFWIESFGLKVNDSKTFSNGYFRESCGTDAFRGYDVTPIYLRSDPDSDEMSSDLSSLIATSNQLWIKCLYTTSNALKEIIESRIKFRLPLTSSKSGLLGWSDRFDTTEAHCWDPVLQTLCIRGHAVSPKFRKDPLSGRPALLKFFLTSFKERVNGHLERTAIRYQTRIVRRRVPANAG